MDKLRELLLQKLHVRYPGYIPAFIKDRFDTEWEYVWFGARSYLLVYQAIMKVAKEAGQPVWNCGFGSGSFLLYLLDKGLNPLPPHWECKGCGRIETDASAELCFDLSVKACPDCKTQMLRNGINGSAEESFPSGKGIEIRVNEDFLDAASQAALSALKNAKVFQQRYNHKPDPPDLRSFFFVDNSIIHQDESGIEYINVEDRNCSADLKSIVVKAQTNAAMSKNALSMEEWIESKPDIQLLLQRAILNMKTQDDYYPENTYQRMQQMIDILQLDTWTSLIEAVCFASGNYTRTGKTTLQETAELIRSSDYRHVLYSREPLQFYLRKQGVPVILDSQMVDQLRVGRNGWEMEVFEQKTPLLKHDALFQSISYLWPRTHAINWMWRYLRKDD